MVVRRVVVVRAGLPAVGSPSGSNCRTPLRPPPGAAISARAEVCVERMSPCPFVMVTMPSYPVGGPRSGDAGV